jgi:hypothetical protein
MNEVESLPMEPFAVFCPYCGDMLPYIDRPLSGLPVPRTVVCLRCRLAWQFQRPTVLAVVVPYTEPT